MTLLHYRNGSLVSGVVPLNAEQGFSARATIGEVDTCRVLAHDPAGTLDFVEYDVWKMVEDACPAGSQVVWHGFIGDQTIDRGDGTVIFPTAAGRVWELELIEDNGYLDRRVITDAASGDRPKESVSTRIAWLLTQPGFTGVIADHGLVAASAVMLDPADYHGKTGADVLRDCALACGFNFFVRYRETSSDLELIFEDSVNSVADLAILHISNVAADVDHVTTWSPGMSGKLKRAASRRATGIHLPFSAGSIYVSNGTTVDQQAPTASVTSLSAATALATRLLAQHAESDKSIEAVRLQLPAANLNDVRQGQLITSARFSHFPGYATAAAMRVLSKSFARPANLGQAVYDVDLDLSPSVTFYAGSAFAALLEEAGGTSGSLYFNTTGDAPSAGWYAEPTVGPLSVVQGAGPYTTIIANQAMTVRVQLDAAFDTVAGTGATVTLNVTRNGGVIGSQTLTNPSGGFWNGYFDIDLPTVTLAAGDIIGFTFSTSFGANFGGIGGWDNPGLPVNTCFLRVGRGTHVWNTGTVTWIGP